MQNAATLPAIGTKVERFGLFGKVAEVIGHASATHCIIRHASGREERVHSDALRSL